jgi:hypothetical protein
MIQIEKLRAGHVLEDSNGFVDRLESILQRVMVDDENIIHR